MKKGKIARTILTGAVAMLGATANAQGSMSARKTLMPCRLSSHTDGLAL